MSPVLEPRQHAFEPVDVHRLAQTIVDRLIGQRMIGNLALSRQIFGAGDLIGKDRRDQILGLHAQELRRNLLAVAKPRQRQRHAGRPAPARGEHRRGEQSLHQQRPHAGGIQIARDLAELETMRRRQGQDDVVLGRRRLKFEIEFAAKSLAQRQSPGAIDAAAERGVDDQLHAARLVEEALEDDACPASAAGRARRGRPRDNRRNWIGGRRARRRLSSTSQRLRLPPDGSDRSRASISARKRETEADSSSARPGASPSQNGMFGGWPWASSTRTVPRSTRWMR